MNPRAEQARQAIRKAYKGHANFMTPKIIEFLTVGKYAIEISWGEGIMPRTKIFGVTVVTLEGEKAPDLCQSFSTLEESFQYIDTLK